MMLYANGYGVEKNLNLAIKAACETGGAIAEIEGRVHHLQELQTKAPNQPLQICIFMAKNGGPKLSKDLCIEGKVDICDDITSGYMEGFCAQIESKIDEQKNAAHMADVVATWPAKDQQSFATLQKATDAYFDSHSRNEIDLSGTGRAAFVIEEKDAKTAAFRKTINNLEHGKPLPAHSANFASADKQLNIIYAATMKKISTHAEQLPFNGITKDGVRDTEKLWISYRDAWVAFAAQHYPAIPAEQIKTWATLDRIATIKDIPISY